MTYKTEVLGLPIEAELKRMGQDWLVSIGGGCRVHIGSISTAQWTGERAELTSTTLENHKDAVIGDFYALNLCKNLKSTVCVVCGIHYDRPGPEGISAIVNASEAMLDEILSAHK